MTNKSSIDLDRNIRLSRLSGRFPRVAYQTAQRRVNSTRTRCQKKIATTFAEVSGVVGEQAGIIFEKLGDRSRNRLNQGCLIGCSEPHSPRFSSSTWFILLKPSVHDASYQARVYVRAANDINVVSYSNELYQALYQLLKVSGNERQFLILYNYFRNER